MTGAGFSLLSWGDNTAIVSFSSPNLSTKGAQINRCSLAILILDRIACVVRFTVDVTKLTRFLDLI